MAGSVGKSYDVVHRDRRFDLADVPYLHYHPAGSPGSAGVLAVLRQLSLVSFGNRPVHAIRNRGVLPPVTACANESSFAFAV